jgi:hypothetical protein
VVKGMSADVPATRPKGDAVLGAGSAATEVAWLYSRPSARSSCCDCDNGCGAPVRGCALDNLLVFFLSLWFSMEVLQSEMVECSVPMSFQVLRGGVWMRHSEE